MAIREILQNGHDACVYYRRTLSPDVIQEYRPQVAFDVEFISGKACVVATDNGIGMTREQLENELSVVGQSSDDPEALAEAVRARGGFDDRVIGQYGIGFLAAFLIANRVDVYTRTQDGTPWHWWCTGDASYFIEPAASFNQRGTKIVLQLKEPQTVGMIKTDFGDLETLKLVVREYSTLLQVPTYVRNMRMNLFSANWGSATAFRSTPESEMTEFLREKFPVEFLDTFRVVKNAEDVKVGRISYRTALFFGVFTGLEVAFFRGGNMETHGGVDVYVKGM